jgi:hypothetical protein
MLSPIILCPNYLSQTHKNEKTITPVPAGTLHRGILMQEERQYRAFKQQQ